MDDNKRRLVRHVMELKQDWQAEDAQRIADIGDALNAMHQIAASDPILPQPCNGPLYDKATLGDHLGKVFEELYELYEAVAQYTNDPDSVKNYDHMCLEATDGITALTTLLEYVKCDESMRQEYQRRVNHSNAVRDGGQRIRRPLSEETYGNQ